MVVTQCPLEVAFRRLTVALHNYDVCHAQEMSDRLLEVASQARKVLAEADVIRVTSYLEAVERGDYRKKEE